MSAPFHVAVIPGDGIGREVMTEGLPGVTSPLAGRGPGDIDMVMVRENTEGEYSSVGGVMF